MIAEPRFLIQLRKPDSIELCGADVPISSVCAKISEFSDYSCAPQTYCTVMVVLRSIPLGTAINVYTSPTGVIVVTKTAENSTILLHAENSIRYRPLPPSDDESENIEDVKKDPNTEAYLKYKLLCLRNLDAAAKWLCAQYTVFIMYLNSK